MPGHKNTKLGRCSPSAERHAVLGGRRFKSVSLTTTSTFGFAPKAALPEVRGSPLFGSPFRGLQCSSRSGAECSLDRCGRTSLCDWAARRKGVAEPRARPGRSPVGPQMERLGAPGRRVEGHEHPGFGGDRARPDPLPWPCEQRASTRWGGAQASRRPAQGAERQPHGTRCLEGHHTSGPQRVHLLGRRSEAGDDPGTSHSPDRGGARGRPASALLLARVQAPRTHRQIAGSCVSCSRVPTPHHRSSRANPEYDHTKCLGSPWCP